MKKKTQPKSSDNNQEALKRAVTGIEYALQLISVSHIPGSQISLAITSIATLNTILADFKEQLKDVE